MTSENPLQAIIAEARRQHLCNRPDCTRCDAAPYRQRLADLAQRAPEALVDAMAGVELAAWYDIENLGAALHHAFDALPSPDAQSAVLSAWLPRVEGHYRLVDAVLYYVVREGWASAEVAERWMKVAEEMAVESGDASLLETLIYTRPERFIEPSALLVAARRARRGHPPLDRALKRLAGSATEEGKSNVNSR